MTRMACRGRAFDGCSRYQRRELEDAHDIAKPIQANGHEHRRHDAAVLVPRLGDHVKRQRIDDQLHDHGVEEVHDRELIEHGELSVLIRRVPLLRHQCARDELERLVHRDRENGRPVLDEHADGRLVGQERAETACVLVQLEQERDRSVAQDEQERDAGRDSRTPQQLPLASLQVLPFDRRRIRSYGDAGDFAEQS